MAAHCEWFFCKLRDLVRNVSVFLPIERRLGLTTLKLYRAQHINEGGEVT